MASSKSSPQQQTDSELEPRARGPDHLPAAGALEFEHPGGLLALLGGAVDLSVGVGLPELTYYTPENNPTLYREAEEWLQLVLAERG